MFGIALYLVFLVTLSWLLGSSQANLPTDSNEEAKVYPEDVFQLIDRDRVTENPQFIYDPWTDDKLETYPNNKNHNFQIVEPPVLLLPPAPIASNISVFEHIKQQKYQEIKSLCSLLKEYGFIGKSQKISGKGATKKTLIQYIKTALENQNANALLAGYLKIS